MPACLIICNDVMAYACGMMFGKRFIKRPLISLSPNKSWEGFVGAFFWTMLFAFMVRTLSMILIAAILVPLSISMVYLPQGKKLYSIFLLFRKYLKNKMYLK